MSNLKHLNVSFHHFVWIICNYSVFKFGKFLTQRINLNIKNCNTQQFVSFLAVCVQLDKANKHSFCIFLTMEYWPKFTSLLIQKLNMTLEPLAIIIWPNSRRVCWLVFVYLSQKRCVLSSHIFLISLFFSFFILFFRSHNDLVFIFFFCFKSKTKIFWYNINCLETENKNKIKWKEANWTP